MSSAYWKQRWKDSRVSKKIISALASYYQQQGYTQKLQDLIRDHCQ